MATHSNHCLSSELYTAVVPDKFIQEWTVHHSIECFSGYKYISEKQKLEAHCSHRIKHFHVCASTTAKSTTTITDHQIQ